MFKCRRTPELKLYTFILGKMQPAISSNMIVFRVMHTTQRLFIGFYLKISSFKLVLQEETQHSWEFQVSQLWIKTVFPQSYQSLCEKLEGGWWILQPFSFTSGFNKALTQLKNKFPALHVTQLSPGKYRNSNKYFLSVRPLRNDFSIISVWLRCIRKINIA